MARRGLLIAGGLAALGVGALALGGSASASSTPSRSKPPPGRVGGSTPDPGPPPNITGDPAGYSTDRLPDPRSARQVLVSLGYAIPITDAPLTDAAARGAVQRFQLDYSKIARHIAAGHITPKPIGGPYQGSFRGRLDGDGDAGAFTHRGFEIAAILMELGSLDFRLALAQANQLEPTPDPAPTPSGGSKVVRQIIAEWADRWDWPDLFLEFSIAAAYTESKFNPIVMNGFTAPPSFPGAHPSNVSQEIKRGEVKASKAAYTKNLKYFEGCGHPLADYTSGSYGLWGALPGNVMAAWFDTAHQCANPTILFQIGPAMIGHLAYCSRIQGWSTYYGTALALRVGMANPGAMAGGPTSSTAKRVRDRLEGAIEATGANISPDTKMPKLPKSRQGFADQLSQWFEAQA